MILTKTELRINVTKTSMQIFSGVLFDFLSPVTTKSFYNANGYQKSKQTKTKQFLLVQIPQCTSVACQYSEGL